MPTTVRLSHARVRHLVVEPHRGAPAMTVEEAPPARRVTTRPKDRADRILAAAAKLFAERGYHAVGIDEIGEAVGVTGPAVYRHFDSKEALLVAATQRSVERVHGVFAELAQVAADPEERLALLVRSTIAATIDDRDLTAVYLRESRHIPSVQWAPIRRIQQMNRRIWFDAVAPLRPDLTPEEILFVVKVVVGVPVSITQHRSTLPRMRLEELLCRFGVAAVLGGGPNRRPRRRRSASANGPGAASASAATRKKGPTTQAAAAVGAQRRSSRREMILTAAVDLFSRHGFRGVGIDDIGATAGISGPGVYRHFRNKEDVLVAAYTRAGEQLAAGASRVLDTAASPREALEQLVESYVDFVMDNSQLVSVYISEVSSLTPERQAHVLRQQRAYIDDWVSLIAQVRPEVGAAEARAMVHAAIGIANGYIPGRIALPPERARALLCRMALDGLLEA